MDDYLNTIEDEEFYNQFDMKTIDAPLLVFDKLMEDCKFNAKMEYLALTSLIFWHYKKFEDAKKSLLYSNFCRMLYELDTNIDALEDVPSIEKMKEHHLKELSVLGANDMYINIYNEFADLIEQINIHGDN